MVAPAARARALPEDAYPSAPPPAALQFQDHIPDTVHRGRRGSLPLRAASDLDDQSGVPTKTIGFRNCL